MPTSSSKESRFLRILLETFKEDAVRHFLQNRHNETTAYTKNESEDNMMIPSIHPPDSSSLQSISTIMIQRPPASGGVIDPFPSKLHSLLESREYEHIISWQPHGRCFVVNDQNSFVEQVMPLYFKQTKFASFQRQLNLYDFKRIYRAGPDKGGYYHELFLRGQPELTFKMIRTKIKGHRKTINNPSMEPNFYQQTPVVPPNPPRLDCSSDHQEGPCTLLPNYVDDHMKTQSMHNLLSPSTVTSPSIEGFISWCERNHQEEEENAPSGTSMISEVTAMVDEGEDSEIGVFAGNHFYLLDDTYNHSFSDARSP
jgi:hypothetical protein